MIVNISPAGYNEDESVISLVYGSRAKMITNESQKNIETKQTLRMNAAYKALQIQLDTAIQTLKQNKISIPPEIKIEESIIQQEESKNDNKQDNNTSISEAQTVMQISINKA